MHKLAPILLVLCACVVGRGAPPSPPVAPPVVTKPTNHALETVRYFAPDASCESIFDDDAAHMSSARCKTPRGEFLVCVQAPGGFKCEQLNGDKPAPIPPPISPPLAAAKPAPKKK